MTIAVRRFQSGDGDALQRLNSRLEAGNSEHRVYQEDLATNPDADLDVLPIYDSLFVAVDGDEIRGGTWIREQYFWVDGERQRVGWLKYPVAESLVDPRYAGVPASMLLQLFREQPRLMAVGMGGHDAPFARLLAAIRWEGSSIPFLFRIVRPFRVLRGLSYARRRWWRSMAMDLVAWSGIGWAAHRLFQAASRSMAGSAAITATVEPRFSPWADAVWEACRGAYGAVAVRDGRTLDHLHPPSWPDLHRVRVFRAGSDVGWVCGKVLPPSKGTTSYFGNLRVGMITDVLALPADAAAVLAEGVRHLENVGVDLVIVYLSHPAWIAAARELRFLSGPSTLAFYRSPGAAELLVGCGPPSDSCHFTYSDGHGSG